MHKRRQRESEREPKNSRETNKNNYKVKSTKWQSKDVRKILETREDNINNKENTRNKTSDHNDKRYRR